MHIVMTPIQNCCCLNASLVFHCENLTHACEQWHWLAKMRSKHQRTVNGCQRDAWVRQRRSDLTKHYGLTFAHCGTQIQSVQGLEATWPVFKFQLTSPLNWQALSNWVSGGLWATTTAANTVFHIAWFVVKAALRSDWVNTESLRYAVSELCWDMTHSPCRRNLFTSAYVDR